MAIKAVQQFHLRTRLNTEKEAMDVMAKMKEAGYEGLELCWFMMHPTSVFYRLGLKLSGCAIGTCGRLDWGRLTREAGLQVPGILQDFKGIEDNLDKTAEEAISLGAKYITLSSACPYDFSSSGAVKALADRLNRSGERFRQYGLQLLFHNHSAEFLHTDEGISAYRTVMENTDPSLVGFELDAYWAVTAGADPLQLMDDLGNRLKLFQVNDKCSHIKGKCSNSNIPHGDTELGTGNMNLEPMIRKAISLGVDAVILEADRGWTDGDSVKSMQISGEYLKKIF
ncbi:MAG: sugar phosphate isomerase/epimerase [Clostridia bacterium]|nr:sugar phosphate isomerase/epimerase [Clostridia bacterium]